MQAPIIAGQLPAAYCYPSSAQQLLNDFAEISHANVPDNVTGISFGPTDPGVYTRPWFNTTTSRLYYYSSNGKWISLYWPPPSSPIRMLWEGTEAQLLTFDEGNAVVLGAELVTGPFWAIDHNYDARFPLGPGTLPISTTAVAAGDIGGLEKVPITEANQPMHRHFISLGPESGDSSYLADEPSEVGTFKVNGAEQIRFYNLASTEVGRTREGGGVAEPTPLDNMPPYRAAYVIKRTARAFYTL